MNTNPHNNDTDGDSVPNYIDWDSDGDLTDGFDGEFTEGTWTLWMQDYSYDAAGTLNNWTLRIYYDDTVTGEESTWSGVKALYR